MTSVQGQEEIATLQEWLCNFLALQGKTPISFSLLSGKEGLSKVKFCVKNKNLSYFDAKIRFVILVSLRSAIFSEI